MPSKKKYNARFPIGRIKRIIQTDEEVGKVALAVPIIISALGPIVKVMMPEGSLHLVAMVDSWCHWMNGQEVFMVFSLNTGQCLICDHDIKLKILSLSGDDIQPEIRPIRCLVQSLDGNLIVCVTGKHSSCLLTRTLELFVESLIKKSMKITIQKNARTLSPHHMKQCILSESRFDFLRDLVRNLPEASTSDDDGNWNSNENWSSNSQEQRRESLDDPSDLKVDEEESKLEKQEENAPKAMNFYKEIEYTNNGNGSSSAMNESDEDDYDS